MITMMTSLESGRRAPTNLEMVRWSIRFQQYTLTEKLSLQDRESELSKQKANEAHRGKTKAQSDTSKCGYKFEHDSEHIKPLLFFVQEVMTLDHSY